MVIIIVNICLAKTQGWITKNAFNILKHDILLRDKGHSLKKAEKHLSI